MKLWLIFLLVYGISCINTLLKIKEILEKRKQEYLKKFPPLEPINSSTAIKLKKRFDRRLSTVKKHCAILASDRSVKGSHKYHEIHNSSFIADYKSQSIICLVLKAGSSSWNDFFWKIRVPGKYKKYKFWENVVHGNRKAFLAMDPQVIKGIWNNPNSTRILTVRHPFSRLVSGYQDKFTKEYYFLKFTKRYPKMRKYLPDPKDYIFNFRKKEYFMKWVDFAQYVAEYGKDYRNNLDGHFHPIVAECDPCFYPFNYIVKIETFDEDIRWLIKKQFEGITYTLRMLNARNKTVTRDREMNEKYTKHTIKEYFSKLKPETVKKIYEIYAKDMVLFGYTFNFTSLKAGWND